MPICSKRSISQGSLRATVLSAVIDFVLAFLLLLGMMLFYGIVPTINIIWLPLLLLLALTTSLGVGLWRGGDERAISGRALERFASPWGTRSPLSHNSGSSRRPSEGSAKRLAYPSSLLSEPWRTLYGINPMVGVVEGFRWALLGSDTAPGPIIIVSALAAVGLLVSGAYYFRRMEKTFADVV